MPSIIKCWGCNSSVEGKHGDHCPNGGQKVFGHIPSVDPALEQALKSGEAVLLNTGASTQFLYVKPKPRTHIPTDAKARKAIPLWTGLVKYFPDALVAVAQLSHIANEQHNPGEPVHWDKSKSTDQEDTLLRHLLDSGTVDTDGVRHSTKVAWRALAKLQLEIEGESKG